MSRRVAWCVHVAVALVGVTGLVYAWMAYLLEPVDEFAVVNHRFQALTQHAHIVVAPLLVFACGLIWTSHVWSRIRSGHRARRRTGVALALSLLPMIASGYLLQVSSSDALRSAWTWVHVASSCLWLILYAWHQIGYRRGRRRD